MPTGTSPRYYPEDQPPPQARLVPENSYFQLSLVGVQGYYAAPPLTRPAYLTIASTLASTFNPNRRLESLHQTELIRRNTPTHVGLQANLTEWLPARRPDSVNVKLKYLVTRDTPFRQLVGEMEQLGLASKLAVVGPEVAIAAKVSEISGRLLSTLLEEGNQESVFEMDFDLSVADLRAGYHVIFGTPEMVAAWPAQVSVNAQGEAGGAVFDRLNVAVLWVQAIPRRGEESARGRSWWERLQGARDLLLARPLPDDAARREALQEWMMALVDVNRLARDDRAYLLAESREIIGDVDREVRAILAPLSLEATQALPEPLQEVFGVETQAELDRLLEEGTAARARSRELRAEYGESG